MGMLLRLLSLKSGASRIVCSGADRPLLLPCTHPWAVETHAFEVDSFVGGGERAGRAGGGCSLVSADREATNHSTQDMTGVIMVT